MNQLTPNLPPFVEPLNLLCIQISVNIDLENSHMSSLMIVLASANMASCGLLDSDT